MFSCKIFYVDVSGPHFARTLFGMLRNFTSYVLYNHRRRHDIFIVNAFDKIVTQFCRYGVSLVSSSIFTRLLKKNYLLAVKCLLCVTFSNHNTSNSIKRQKHEVIQLNMGSPSLKNTIVSRIW